MTATRTKAGVSRAWLNSRRRMVLALLGKGPASRTQIEFQLGLDHDLGGRVLGCLTFVQGEDGRYQVNRCRDCKRRPVTRNLGLCGRCYQDPAVRAIYTTQTPPEVPDRYGFQPLPELPTDARPGSEAKISILEARALTGSQLWHPRDWRDLD